MSIGGSLLPTVQCLWLRVRVVLVQCIREAVLFTGARSGNKRPPPSPSGKSDPSGTSSEEGVASSLGQRIRDFSKCINLLDQHVGILILRQRKGTLVSCLATIILLVVQKDSESDSTLDIDKGCNFRSYSFFYLFGRCANN